MAHFSRSGLRSGSREAITWHTFHDRDCDLDRERRLHGTLFTIGISIGIARGDYMAHFSRSGLRSGSREAITWHTFHDRDCDLDRERRLHGTLFTIGIAIWIAIHLYSGFSVIVIAVKCLHDTFYSGSTFRSRPRSCIFVPCKRDI